MLFRFRVKFLFQLKWSFATRFIQIKENESKVMEKIIINRNPLNFITDLSIVYNKVEFNYPCFEKNHYFW